MVSYMSQGSRNAKSRIALRINSVLFLLGIVASGPALAEGPGQTGDSIPTIPGLRGPRHSKSVQRKLQMRDAAADGWDTEVFNNLAGAQLKRLGKLLGHPDRIDVAHLRDLAADDISCTPLRPKSFDSVFQDGAVRVRQETKPSQEPSGPLVGLESFVEAVKQLALPFGGDSRTRVKFKIVTVEPHPDSVTTVAYFHAAGWPSSGAVQQNATWTCRWVRGANGEPPRLTWIGVDQFVETTSPAGGKTLMADCTEAVLGQNASFREQLLVGLDQWRASIHSMLDIGFTGPQGLSVSDINGDGLDDLFVCQPGGLPNRLYVQNPDGTATDVSAEMGVDFLESTRSSLIIDIDNDGDQDLVLATGSDVFFFLNQGSGKLVPSAVVPLPYALAISAADYDNDGDLDIYVCCYSDPDRATSTPIPYHDANTGRPNVMLRNEGRGQFIDVTELVGLNANNRRFTFAASWEDYDNDGDLDLYVANDYGRNNLYRNDSGWFKDVAAQAGVEDISAGMSVSWGDYNNDGLVDLYVSNMFSSAGNRITYQRRFKTEVDQSIRSQFQRHARGNSLFENVGDGTFRDVSVESGTTMGRWAWSSNFIDFNNDSHEDLFIANGFVTNEDTKDL